MAIKTYDGLFVDRAPRRPKVLSVAQLGNIVGLGSGADGTSSAAPSYATLATPGDTVPANNTSTSPVSGMTRPEMYAFATAAVQFDGSTMLYNLPRPPASCSSFSLSCWVQAPGNTGVLFDVNSPATRFAVGDPISTTHEGPQTRIAAGTGMARTGAGLIATVYNLVTDAIAFKYYVLDATAANGPFVNSAGGDPTISAPYAEGTWQRVDYTPAASAFAAGTWPAAPEWVHLMISGRRSTVTFEWYVTIATNNDVLLDGRAGFTALAGQDMSSIDYDATGTISGEDPAHLEGAYYYDNQRYDQKTNIGGRARLAYADFQYSTPTADGWTGGLAEFWLAFNQYIDWTVEANRLKFHVVSSFGDVFAPCDLGSTGATPTGTAPHVYLSGPPTIFPLNRARGGAALSVEGALILLTSTPYS